MKEFSTFLDKESAEISRGVLESHGINAAVMADDSGGMRPYMSLGTGVRLMVQENQFEDAKEILNLPVPEEAIIEPEEITPADLDRKSVKRAYVSGVFGMFILPGIANLYSFYWISNIKSFRNLTKRDKRRLIVATLFNILGIVLLTYFGIWTSFHDY